MSEAGDGAFGTGGSGAPFERLGIVGLGLMGGSLALAVRARWPDVTIVGVDRPEVVARALARGAIDAVAASAAEAAARELDLLILAAPVLQNVACLRAVAGSGGSAARPLLVSDLGSTKLAIVEAARSLPFMSVSMTFIGGHPMAGAAQGGFGAARADLFRGRSWIFTPSGHGQGQGPDVGAGVGVGCPPVALDRLRAFVSALGARPFVMEAAEHDRVMAHVSHLPQIVASGLMRVIGERVGVAGLAVSGPGLADSTRLASSPADVWAEICQTNAPAIAAALDALIAELQHARQQLDEPEAMAAWLEAGARWRAQLPASTTSAGPTAAGIAPAGASAAAATHRRDRSDQID